MRTNLKFSLTDFVSSKDQGSTGRPMHIVRVVEGISTHFPNRVSSWALGAMMTHIGFFFLTHHDTFDKMVSYKVMSRLGSEQNWGWVCVFVGLLRLAMLVVNGTFVGFRFSPHFRAVTSMLSCFVWLQFTLSFMASVIQTPGVALYPYLLLLDLYNVFSASQEACHVEDVRKNGRAGNSSGHVYRVARMGTNRS